MEIRGDRECQACGTRWSYYETGSVECPACGSPRSVGTDNPTRHTASAATLDLSPARDRLDASRTDASRTDTGDTREAAERAAEACRAFASERGFIHAGEFRGLDTTYLAALELRTVAAEVARTMHLGDETERYFLSLLAGADQGERPDSGEVPEEFRAARGLASAKAVREYRREASTYLDDHPDRGVRAAFGSLAEHAKRVHALDGDVPPETADRLVAVARDLGTALRENDETALATARDRLDRLG